MIYRRKSDLEIERIKKKQERESFSPMMPLWLSLGSAVLIFLFVSHFPARFSAPLGFSLTSLFVALSSGLGVFVFLYVMQVLTRRMARSEPGPEICSACHEANRHAADRCPCGGTYEPLAFYDEINE